MKVSFAGTPDFAATILLALMFSSHDVGLVVSQPDRRRGRGRKATSTPVAEVASSNGLPLQQPTRISEISAELADHDVLVVAAYGQILRQDTLYAARHGAYNVHASLLPRYRGAAPIERAIMNGETETGVTIMRMDEGLDTGPLALQRSVGIPPEMSGGELTDQLATVGGEAIVESLDLLEDNNLTLVDQDSIYATYASKISDEERIIGWDRGSGEVHDLIRALAPRTGARTFHPEVDGPVKIWRSRVVEESAAPSESGHILAESGRMVVRCGTGSLEVLELQMPGGKRLRVRDFLLGNPLTGAFEGR